MSAQTKTKAQKAGKFLGIALFAFLMFFNIKFALGDSANGDVDLFGLKVSVFTNSTYASMYDCHPYTCWWLGSCGGQGGNLYAIGSATCGLAYSTCVTGYSGDFCNFFQ